jgi:two-component system, NarL family, nitrate/nitrite response regulator NarL
VNAVNAQKAPRPSILIADDHRPTRLAMRELLDGNGFDVVGDTGDARSAVRLARRLRPDICLLDINMPGDGLVAAQTIHAQVPDTVVVMLTVSDSDAHLFEALRVGAKGYLVKGGDPDDIIERLRATLDGEPALSEGVTMRIIDQFQDQRSRRVYLADRGFVSLSVREAEVLDALRAGLRTDQIARRLHVAPVTVRSHVSALLRKLGARNRDEAIALVDGAGLS